MPANTDDFSMQGLRRILMPLVGFQQNKFFFIFTACTTIPSKTSKYTTDGTLGLLTKTIDFFSYHSLDY